MSGIEMMPHWVLLVSFYIQWKSHQAWQQCKTSSYYGRNRKIVEETKQYLLYIQSKYSLNGVDHLRDNLWYSEIMTSTMIWCYYCYYWLFMCILTHTGQGALQKSYRIVIWVECLVQGHWTNRRSWNWAIEQQLTADMLILPRNKIYAIGLVPLCLC